MSSHYCWREATCASCRVPGIDRIALLEEWGRLDPRNEGTESSDALGSSWSQRHELDHDACLDRDINDD